MKPYLLFSIVFVAALLQGCGTMETAPAQKYVTANMSVDAAKKRVMERIAVYGGFCTESKNTLKCETAVTPGQDLAVRLLVSGPYGGETKRTQYFTFIGDNKATRVYIRAVLTAHKAYGSTIDSEIPLTQADMNTFQKFFDEAGKR